MRHPSGTQGQSSGFREEATATDAREAHARAAASKLKLVSPPLPRFRPLVAADQDRLWHWLHVALWDPPPAPLRPVEILQSQGRAHLCRGLGPRDRLRHRRGRRRRRCRSLLDARASPWHGVRFCLRDSRRPKISAAPRWQGGKAKLHPQRCSELKPTQPAGMPR